VPGSPSASAVPASQSAHASSPAAACWPGVQAWHAVAASRSWSTAPAGHTAHSSAYGAAAGMYVQPPPPCAPPGPKPMEQRPSTPPRYLQPRVVEPLSRRSVAHSVRRITKLSVLGAASEWCSGPRLEAPDLRAAWLRRHGAVRARRQDAEGGLRALLWPWTVELF
jgi:hypothetical protein